MPFSESSRSEQVVVDTHSHLLPGVDHGSADLSTSLYMARVAAEAGVATVVCTPHLYEYDWATLQRAQEAVSELRSALREENIALELRLGFEATIEVLATADREGLQSLVIEGSAGDGGEGAIIIEMPFQGWPVFLEETVFRLSAEGFIPVLAHPERNDRVQNDPYVLEKLLAGGAVLQGTAGSLSPLFRRSSQRTFQELLARGWFSLLASDAHADSRYTYSLVPLLEELAGRVSDDTLDMLVRENPSLLLKGHRPRRVERAMEEGRQGKAAGLLSRLLRRQES